MLLSSGVIWRYSSPEAFRVECPAATRRCSELIVSRLDEALVWLEALGAPVVERETGNARTVGVRFDTGGLTTPSPVPAVSFASTSRSSSYLRACRRCSATGGFQGDTDLVRRHVTSEADHLLLRANPWSSGDGLRLGLAAGAATSRGMDEFYGRNMPAPPARVDPEAFVAAAQLYARHARVESETLGARIRASASRGRRSTSSSGLRFSPARVPGMPSRSRRSSSGFGTGPSRT